MRFNATYPLFCTTKHDVNISRTLTPPDQQLLHRVASTPNKFAIAVSTLAMTAKYQLNETVTWTLTSD